MWVDFPILNPYSSHIALPMWVQHGTMLQIPHESLMGCPYRTHINIHLWPMWVLYLLLAGNNNNKQTNKKPNIKHKAARNQLSNLNLHWFDRYPFCLPGLEVNKLSSFEQALRKSNTCCFVPVVSRNSGRSIIITKTCLYNFDPLNPTFI